MTSLMFKCRTLGLARGVTAALLALVGAVVPGPQGWQSARANSTDIATQPVFAMQAPAVVVKPNIMLMLDDSGSMASNYMPDDASAFNGKYGYVSSQCNGIYYNPNITYTPPVDSTGASYGNQSFTAAAVDGFGLTTGTTNLSTSFKPGSYTTQAAFYYTYTGTQTTQALKTYFVTTSTFYRECVSSLNATPGSNVFTKVVVSATSGPGGTDERTNFANWYSYYSVRVNMLKTVVGQTFSGLTDQFRVGFMTINNNAAPAFLNLADFDTTQKANFFTKLYSTFPGGSTPLRASLSTVGRMYAHKATTINGVTVTDPVQYSCQQNYVIASTDGYWNESDSSVKQVDGSTQMGNQDGTLPRPYNDGSTVTTTTVPGTTTTAAG